MVIAGSPRTVAERLAAFREQTGPFETLIISHHDWVPRDLWRRHMHLVAHEMLPILRDLTGTQASGAGEDGGGVGPAGHLASTARYSSRLVKPSPSRSPLRSFGLLGLRPFWASQVSAMPSRSTSG